ncbi:hypothetical protein [Streptomyces hundungensis]|uniref:hypothetical protein n=1 Tax=Streptomyces hundungensis TaxID=1077946 RepID=UPI0033EAE654
MALSWVWTAGFGFFGLLIAEVTDWKQSGPVSGAAACFGTVALTRRICGARVILGPELVVVNPLFTYRLSYRSIREVGLDGGGGLTIRAVEDVEIQALAFGGSLIDMFVGTSRRAAESIDNRRRLTSSSDPRHPMRRTLTRAWVADAFLVAAVGCAVLAGILGS